MLKVPPSHEIAKEVDAKFTTGEVYGNLSDFMGDINYSSLILSNIYKSIIYESIVN